MKQKSLKISKQTLFVYKKTKKNQATGAETDVTTTMGNQTTTSLAC